ncbi:tetratricopeptide repeat protein [Rhodothermus profundi]|uniref:Tetratricopeptide repeat-containing protein n=1 Tax=Rhodothermus profundi TaxID=633813 RepID=A0A1M6WRF3_9BACT|nr:tetratricopeptide repeat protein [Rhodothermus profundi]SHK96340.1 Tetratricopeptide repeat-containing protein [Rhodothermus profundi]
MAVASRTDASKRKALREDTVVTLYARWLDFYYRRRREIYVGGAVIVVIILGLIGYSYYQQQQEQQAQQLLGEVLPLYEQGKYREALDGADGRSGLLELARAYGHTNAGNLARFYAADALYRLGEYEQALELWAAFDSDDPMLAAAALAGQAAVYENKGEHERAAELYRRAADRYDNPVLTPHYLLRAGRNYEIVGNLEAARRMYETLRERYPEALQATEAEIALARIAARASQAS